MTTTQTTFLKLNQKEEEDVLSAEKSTKITITFILHPRDMLHSSVVLLGLAPKKSHVLKEKVPVSILMKHMNTQIFTVKMVSGVKKEKVVLDMAQENMLMVLNLMVPYKCIIWVPMTFVLTQIGLKVIQCTELS